MDIDEILEVLRKYKDEIMAKYNIKRMAIFGSRTRNEASSESDIDIYVEFEEPIGWEFVDLCEELEGILGTKVDVLTKDALVSKPLLWEAVRRDLIFV